MKRVLRIFFVGILAISLTSCLTTLILESLVDSVAGGQNNKEYDFEINTFCEYIIVNNSSRDVRVYFTHESENLMDPNYRAVNYPVVPQGGRCIVHTYKSIGKKSDDISAAMKANPYALFDLAGRKIMVYEYDPEQTTYQVQIKRWLTGDGKQLSPFVPSNWTLFVHKDLTTIDNGTWVGMYDCSYTYYITDEALQE